MDTTEICYIEFRPGARLQERERQLDVLFGLKGLPTRIRDGHIEYLIDVLCTTVNHCVCKVEATWRHCEENTKPVIW